MAFRVSIKAYRKFITMKQPDWAHLNIPPIDYQDIIYYAAPKKKQLNSLDEVDPELLETFAKLGISLDEQKMLSGVAVDVVFDIFDCLAQAHKHLLLPLGDQPDTHG